MRQWLHWRQSSKAARTSLNGTRWCPPRSLSSVMRAHQTPFTGTLQRGQNNRARPIENSELPTRRHISAKSRHHLPDTPGYGQDCIHSPSTFPELYGRKSPFAPLPIMRKMTHLSVEKQFAGSNLELAAASHWGQPITPWVIFRIISWIYAHHCHHLHRNLMHCQASPLQIHPH